VVKRRMATGGSTLARHVVACMTEAQTKRSPRRVGAVLMYHGIAEDPEDRGQSTSPRLSLASFRTGLEHLRRSYDVVPAHELYQRIERRTRTARIPVALTFDDDLESHHSIVAPLLMELGLPASFFLTGSGLQGPPAFWWDDLDELYARGQRREVLREAGLGADRLALKAPIGMVSKTIQMMAPERRDKLAQRLREMVGVAPREPGLSAANVRKLAADGFEIGFHTRSHYQLQTLSDHALEQALRDGLGDLAEAAGRPIVGIAYPHTGADLRVAAAAAAAGFELGFTGNNRPVRPDDHPLLTERIDAWPCTADGFAFRLARTLAAV